MHVVQSPFIMNRLLLIMRLCGWCLRRHAVRAQKGLRTLALAAVFGIQAVHVFAQEDFDAWKQQTQTAFQTYLSEQDKAFVSFLKKQWQSVETQVPSLLDAQPKPTELPKAPKPTQLPVEGKPAFATGSSKPTPRPKLPETTTLPKTPIQPPVPAASPPTKDDTLITFVFYGHKLSYYYDRNLRQTITNLNADQAIARYYQVLATTRYGALIDALISTQQSHRLNDWSYVLLLHQVSKFIEPRSEARRTLLTWFLCLKSGYAARVAYDRQGILLLLPSRQPLFGVTYFNLSGDTYYALNLDVEERLSTSSGHKFSPGRRLYTYEGRYPEADKAIDFSKASAVGWMAVANQAKLKNRERSFRYGDEEIRLSYRYQPEWVSYLNSLPQMDLPHYFSAPLPAVTAASLLEQLGEQVHDRTLIDAVNLLLRFVQKAFAYKTDAQQFQRENYLFPIETLHYPYSDCEDRAALFAWLVRELLGLEVVILDYPGHVATAVALQEGPDFGQFVYQQKRFWVADPTYINAQVGQSMPAFHQVSPKILTYAPLP